MKRLGELGWINGRTIVIEYRWDEGRPNRVAEISAEFVHLKVDVIVTYGVAVPIIKQTTSVIPIIFGVATDPVGGGLVASSGATGRQRHWIVERVRTILPANGWNSYVRSYPVSAGWQSCLMSAIP